MLVAMARLGSQETASLTKDDIVFVLKRHMSALGKLPDVFRMDYCHDHDLQEISVDELQYLFSSKAISSVQYVTYCLERIRKVRLSSDQLALSCLNI